MIPLRFDGLTRGVPIIVELIENNVGRIVPFVLNWDPLGVLAFFEAVRTGIKGRKFEHEFAIITFRPGEF
jgi:hypothetical protein